MSLMQDHALTLRNCITPGLLVLTLSTVVSVPADIPAASPPDRPNIIVIFTDDQGYGDVGVYGADDFQTPHLDKMAAQGMRFTDFYVAQPVCSASRAALLTGVYPNRIGIHGALGPGANHGLHRDETTIAELLKTRGYATALFGKWHLGHHPPFLPTRHGFDEYYGLPYSNDMWPYHPTNPKAYPPLPLIEGEQVVARNPNQNRLTADYTRRAVSFIRKNRKSPFFLYLAHSMPHVPLFASRGFRGGSRQGSYGDVIQEIDWSVGRILRTLRRLGLDERTLVIFTSDNGPWLSYGDHAGSSGPLREGKGTTFEGGVRVPAIMRWPGQIPAHSVCSTPAMTIDLLPTLAHISGASLPERPIDGRNIWHLMSGKNGHADPPPVYLFYYRNNELQALRQGRWKIHFPHIYRTLAGNPGGTGGRPVPYEHPSTGLELYDLEADIGETRDLSREHPEVVERLLELARQARRDLGDSLTEQVGRNVREPGRIPSS